MLAVKIFPNESVTIVAEEVAVNNLDTSQHTVGFTRESVIARHSDSEPSAEVAEAISSLPAGSALLVALRGPNFGARFLLDTVKSTAGRHPDAEIFLDDVTVSRKHAEFQREGSSFFVKDLGSLNGTYFDGNRIEAAELHNGGEVQVGKFRLTFYASPADLDALSVGGR